MHMPKFIRVAFAVALALSASSAYAEPRKCQAALEKIENKWASTVKKSLAKCTDGVQKAVDGGDSIEGDICDSAILKLHAARTKTLTKCLGIACTDQDLLLLGHMVSGINAPVGLGVPSASISPGGKDFVCSFLLKRAEHLAIQGALAAAPEASALWKAAADADLTPDDGIAQWAHGADVNGGVGPWPDSQPSCVAYACSLTGSSGGTLRSPLNTMGTPLTLGRILQLDVCRLPASGYAITNEARLIAGAINKSLAPVSFLSNSICIRNLQAEGWCNCGAGVNAPKNYSVCQDSCVGAGKTDSCTETNVLANETPDPDGCQNGQLKASYDTASATGDCMSTISFQLKITPMSAFGADGVACTADDLVAPLPPLGIQFTTGTATGSLKDAGATSPVETAATYNDSRSGAGIGCAALDAGVLTGLRLVGQQPVLDLDQPTGMPIEDGLLSLTLQCL